METVFANFVGLKGKQSKVILDHHLWKRQTFNCERLQVINDSERLGVIIKGQPKYMYKRDIISVTDNSISDGKLTITIK